MHCYMYFNNVYVDGESVESTNNPQSVKGYSNLKVSAMTHITNVESKSNFFRVYLHQVQYY